MFSTMMRTNRQPANVFYFLHIFFFLHICTAFLTIVNALNNNDNEAIIQLSIDSIHVVKSSDPRFASIEENADDDEEKELLIALLTSFDDNYKTPIQILTEKPSKSHNNNDVSVNNNCTSSSPTIATTTTPFSSSSSSSSPSSSSASSVSSLSIRFIPPLLSFGEQSVAIPRMQSVLIINDDSEPLELQSLSGTTVQFYSSFFTQKTIASNGGNTSINVYYLPRTFGPTKSTFTIKTDRGTLNYYVNGIGQVNPFHLRPLIGATVPLNSTFEYLIHFYNPHNHSIDINEIYTSDENLIIELLSYKEQQTKTIKSFKHREQWHFEPYQKKPIIKLNYLAYQLDRLHGFYCIKTNSNDTIVVPIELNVSNRLSLYSNVDLLEFDADNLIRSTAQPITIPVYVINNGLNPVTITDVRVTVANVNYTTIHHEKAQVPNGIHHLTKVAELTIHPHLIPHFVKRIRGSVQIYTLSSPSSADNEPVLQIPFRATVLHGSLDYVKESTQIYIPSPTIVSADTRPNECRPIQLINRFNTSLTIYNVTVDKPQLLSQYIDLRFYAPYVHINANQTASAVCVRIHKRSLSVGRFTNLEATITLHTNLSVFHLPIYLYSGLLNLNLVTDSTNGGIRNNDTNPLEYFIASIPMNVSRTVKILLTNTNPINVTVEKIVVTLPKSNIQLSGMQLLNGTETNVPFVSSYRNDDISELVIPALHQAVFSLTISGTSDPSSYNETITFKTAYETIHMNVKYRIVSGMIEPGNDLPLHIDVFPYRVGAVDMSILNRFDEPIDVTRIEFPSYGKCFSFVWNNSSPGKLIVGANQSYRIGELRFDMIPLCSSITVPSESTCYCGLNNYPEFKQRWELHVSALNTYELDHTLILKFRNLWKEWNSLVRKHRIQTNIWIITDQANASWPVTIGFVWPSVLEHMSSSLARAPIILDFHLTLTTSIKTQNIIIANPSSNVLQYSVQLISSYEGKRTKKKQNVVGNNQVFDITMTSKRVDVSDGVYKFSLQPNEHIIFTTSYRPKLAAKHEIYFVVRNNLTIIESILLRGEGGSGSLTVGNRNAGSSDIPLVLEMNEKQYKLCSNYLSTDGTRVNPVLQKIVTLRNTGNMKAIIHNVSFGSSMCSGQGFTLNMCSGIEIEPNERYDLHIRFQPDYTLAEIAETLTLNTNIGLMTFPIIVRIPQRVLATCYQNVPRPVWEPRMHYLCLCFVVIFLCYIMVVAVYGARRLFHDYLARSELRNRLPSANSIDLADLTAAVQEEQRIRERAESRSPTNTMNLKKDVPKDENKTKENEVKVRRVSATINGSKDIGETSSKSSRTPDGSAVSVRSVATSPKATPNKARRATTDNGVMKTTKQQQHEAPAKPQPLRTQKPVSTDPSPTIVVRSPTPPSTVTPTAVSDEESEPFVIARSKRVSSKTKEPTPIVIPTKSTPSVDNVISAKLVSPVDSGVPLPTIPVPPSLPSAPITMIPKSPTVLDAIEPRQNQQDASRASDPIKDQQWYMVGSNRGGRRGTTVLTGRRETIDESQTVNKTNKTILNNPENPVVSSSSASHTHASVSNQVNPSRRRRGRRPTRALSPAHAPIINKRKSLQHNTPFSAHNRELAFRQLTEQLWAAGLPSSATACSMSVRSRCSSAPPSERGGGDDDMKKNDWSNNYHDNEESLIYWDEPADPDDDFGRYVSQTDQNVEELNDINEWTQQPSLSATTMTTTTTNNEIPPLMSLSAAASPVVPINTAQKITASSPIIKEDIDPLPFLQHGPGPIQRPNKLFCPSMQPSTNLMSSVQSPGTPDVLYQLNRLLDHQNSATSSPASVSIVNNSSVPINDLATPNVGWTTFSPTEWQSKYDSPWPLTNLQSPAVPLTTQVQNPFALISRINEQSQQPTPEESSVWPSVLNTATPRLVSSSTRTQRASIWNDIFSSTVPSATESTKAASNTCLKFFGTADPSSADVTSPNGHGTETNNPFWSLGTLSGGPIAPPIPSNHQPTSSSSWWPNSSSDENNNKSQANQANDDKTSNRDQSRWDFAR